MMALERLVITFVYIVCLVFLNNIFESSNVLVQATGLIRHRKLDDKENPGELPKHGSKPKRKRNKSLLILNAKPKGKKSSSVANQKLAIDKWASLLDPEKDYNATNWRYLFRSRSASDFFDQYLRKLSKVFKESNAIVNFALVGACDGISDPTIKYRYLKLDHWRGVFVEPMTINVRDLTKFLADNGAANRSLVIQAAATDVCAEPTIKVERPLYEEKANSSSIPHWLRRQIGSIVPKTRDHARPEWMLEEVACLTAPEILLQWAESTSTHKQKNKEKRNKNKKTKKRRPHILKIDAEGHDYEVLMGFVGPDTPVQELPLLIEFEAKSIGPKFPTAKANLEARGYVVTPFGQDGFAMLRHEYMLPQKGMKRREQASTNSNTEEEQEAVPESEPEEDAEPLN